MKKFLSLFCALAIVLSASAAPVKKARAAKFQRAAVEQLRAEKQITAKKAVKKNAFAAKEVTAKKAERLAPAAKMQTAASLFRAPKAAAVDTTVVKCGSWEIEDWGEDGELYLYGEDNTIAFYFDLIYGGDATDLQLGKVYTAEDIWIDDQTGKQYGSVFYDGKWNDGIKELSLVKTIDENGLVHFAGTCVDSLDAAFKFYYDEEEFVPTGDTVSYAFAKKVVMTYSNYFEDWTIKVDDGAYALQLDIFSDNATSPAGNYDSKNDDFDLDYTHLEVYTSKDSSNLYAAKAAKASIFVENDTTIILAEILAENGVVYEFAAFYAAPTKQGEDTIVATNLAVSDAYFDWFGIVFVEAENEDFSVSFNLYPETADYLGSYTIGGLADGEITIAENDETVAIFSGSINLAKTEEGLVLTGKVLCENNIEYTLDLQYVKPTKTREESITITDAVLTIYPEYGDWQVVGLNADNSRYVAIDIFGDEIAGTYTEEDIDAYYTYIDNVFVRNDSLILSEQFDPLSLNITVAFNAADSIATITGTYLGQGYLDNTDVPEFTLNITAKVVVYGQGGGETEPNPYDAESDFSVQFPSYDIDDQFLADYGVLFIEAQNENNEYVSLELWLPENADSLVAGEYIVSPEEFVPSSITATELDMSEGNIYGSFAGILSAQGISELWFIASGKAVVTESGVIELIAKSTKGYSVEARLGTYPEAIDNTAVKAAATKRIVNGALVIEKNGALYNAQGAQVK